VSLDGTHIRASASKDKNVTSERACELCAQLRLDVDELLAQAERSDREDTDPQALPTEPSGARSPKGGAFARRAAPEGAGKSPGAKNSWGK